MSATQSMGTGGAVFVIRPAEKGDLDRLTAIETAAFTSDRLSRRALAYAIVSAPTYSPVALVDDIVVGYGLLNFRKGSKKARISSLAAPHAPKGCGRALMAACDAEAIARGCNKIVLEVRSDNQAAIALYDKLGFTLFGRYDDYYEDGGSALRYEKSLF